MTVHHESTIRLGLQIAIASKTRLVARRVGHQIDIKNGLSTDINACTGELVVQSACKGWM